MFSVLIHLLSLFLAVVADVSVSEPASGQSFTVSGGSANVKVLWIDDGSTPSSDTIVSMTMVLCTGDNSNIVAVSTIDLAVSKTDISAKTYLASIKSNLGKSGVYFLQVYATYSAGSTIHYTRRFQLDSMTGTTAASGSIDLAPPAAQKNIAAAGAVAGGAGVAVTIPADASLSFTVPYTMQTGLVKFAPMQQQPGSTVTASTWTRKFPTSSVSYYLEVKSSLNCLSTITPGWSYIRTSLVNFASPAPNPDILSWYAPQAKLKLPTLMSEPTPTAKHSKRFE